MDDIKLPPLPPTRLRFEVSINSLGERLDYTAEDMRAYARAALAAAPAPHPDTADAERYRWLREHGDRGCTEKDGYGGQTLRMGDDLDAAIDAARAQAQKR